MTAPKTKRNQPAFNQLGVWIRSGTMRQLQAAAAAENRAQRDVVEDALAEYFKKPKGETSAKASSA